MDRYRFDNTNDLLLKRTRDASPARCAEKGPYCLDRDDSDCVLLLHGVAEQSEARHAGGHGA